MDSIYGFDKYRVIVECADEELMEWVNLYLLPFFDICTNGISAKWIVKVSFGFKKLEEMKQEFLSAHTIQSLTKTEHPDLRTSFYSETSKDYFVVEQQDPDTLLSMWSFCIDKRKNEVTLVVAPNQLESKYVVARTVRSLLIGMAAEDGWSIMHSSCVSTRSGGYIALGDKGVGKTAVMLAALRNRNNYYVANDRVLIKRIGNDVIAQGLPYSPAVKKKVLNSINAPIASNYIFQGTDTKVRFLVRDFCKLFNTTVKSQTKLDKVIFPRYRNDSGLRGVIEDNTNIIINARFKSICEFQPVWNEVFRINFDAPLWLNRLTNFWFDYNDETIETLVDSL